MAIKAAPPRRPEGLAATEPKRGARASTPPPPPSRKKSPLVIRSRSPVRREEPGPTRDRSAWNFLYKMLPGSIFLHTAIDVHRSTEDVSSAPSGSRLPAWVNFESPAFASRTHKVPFRLENSTLAAGKASVCRIPIYPQSDLKCVGEPAEMPFVLEFGVSQPPPEGLGFVPLGTDRSALEVFGNGRGHMLCAKMDNSLIKCWGLNDQGQLGLGNTDDKGDTAASMGNNLPVLNLGSDGAVLKVVMGREHACALLDNGKMKCWGSNNRGQLGTPTAEGDKLGDDLGEMGDQLPFVDLGPDALEVVDVAAGAYATCAIFKDRSLACWGWDGQPTPGGDGGQLGRGVTVEGEISLVPQLVDLGGGHHPIQVEMGNYHTCALLNTSEVKCWGQSQWGMLGNGNKITIGNDATDMGEELATVPVGKVTKIAAGAYHTCAILESGGVTCWGWNVHGQTSPPGTLPDDDLPLSSIGDDPDEVSPTNLIVDGNGQNLDAIDLACGDLFSCARLIDQSIYCWGTLNDKYAFLN
eukprot:s2957_g15.t1